MTDQQKTTGIQPSSLSPIAWQTPSFAPAQMKEMSAPSMSDFRLFHITEIGEGKASAYRLAMANVVATLDNPECRALYVLSGTPEGIRLYIGVAGFQYNTDELQDMAKTLKTSFEGNFLGAQLEQIKPNDSSIRAMQDSVKYLGLVTGVPSFNESKAQGDDDFQGLERLVNSMIGETWQLIVVAEPGRDEAVQQTLERIYDFSTQLSEQQKQSVQRSENTGWNHSNTSGTSTSKTQGSSTSDTRGKSQGGSEDQSKNTGTSSGTSTTHSQGSSTSQGKNWGTNESRTTGVNDATTIGNNTTRTEGHSGGQSVAFTVERTNKHIEEMQKHLSEHLIPRFQQGRSKGMFRTAVYVAAQERSTYDRLARGVLSIFQGNESTMTPLRADKLTAVPGRLPLHLREFEKKNADPDSVPALAHSIPFEFRASRLTVSGSTWLTTSELALVAGLPTKELPGLKIRKSVDFALNTPNEALDAVHSLELGHIVQHGRILKHKPIRLPKGDLNKHVFITGVTGAGKTTTCMKLLLESGLPFMVIEPAKTEYRALHGERDDIHSYVLGREDITPFRLNPFELVSSDENLAGHIDTLKATLSAVFPMEASMPYIVAEAIIRAYKAKGWDIHSGENFLVDEPWADDSTAWPIFSDMIHELDAVITSAGMGKEFEEKYKGSLVSRLSDLTLGTKGRMLNTRRSLNFDALLDKKVVIELEELKDEQDKALFMGFILQRLAECMKHRHRKDKTFKHLTLVEEAHRLLSRPEPGESDSKKQGVETFANMLAEVRKYGEGLIIADQIPNKLVSDVIKNTHTKIVHRLFAADDRNTIGDAMGLSEDQKNFLPLLQPGETVMYCGGWHGAVRVQIKQQVNTTEDDISDAVLKDKGMKLMWAQRRRLYCRTTAHPFLNTPEQLAELVKQGVKAINLMLRINCCATDKQQAPMHQRFQDRYQGVFLGLGRTFDIDKPTTSAVLTDLFFDLSGFMKSAKTDALVAEVLSLVWLALGESLTAFQTVRETPKGRAVLLDEFVNQRKLEAI